MWILFRLILAVAAFAARQFGRFGRGGGRPVTAGGHTVLLAERTHKGRIVEYFVGVELKTPIWFRLQRETEVDRWFKRMDFATEAETRDPAFDDFVYIVCDHPMLPSLLRRSAEARWLIRELLHSGADRIDYVGKVMWCSMKLEPSEHARSLVAELGEALRPLERDFSSRFSDPFLWKALAVEGVVWSIAAFGAGAVLEADLRRSIAIHVNNSGLIDPGLALAVGLFAVLVGGVRFFLRGSSRGHRLIIESAVVLALGLPVCGIQLFADLNRSLDTSEVEIAVKVANCLTTVRRVKSTQTFHRLHLAGPQGAVWVPSEILVASNICRAATPGAVATITLGRGAFGQPWYRRISIGAKTWSP